MKKLDKHFSKEFTPVILYLEDLNSIERILREKGEDFAIKHADCSYDSVRELVQETGPKEIREVDIEAKKPYVSIHLWRTSTRVRVGTGDVTLASGIFHQVEEVISHSQRRPGWIYKFPGNLILIILGNLIYAVFNASGHGGLSTGGPLIVLCGLLYAWMFWVALSRHSLIRLYEKPAGFVTRNRDQLIIQTFTALISAVAGYLLATVQKWFFP